MLKKTIIIVVIIILILAAIFFIFSDTLRNMFSSTTDCCSSTIIKDVKAADRVMKSQSDREMNAKSIGESIGTGSPEGYMSAEDLEAATGMATENEQKNRSRFNK